MSKLPLLKPLVFAVPILVLTAFAIAEVTIRVTDGAVVLETDADSVQVVQRVAAANTPAAPADPKPTKTGAQDVAQPGAPVVVTTGFSSFSPESAGRVIYVSNTGDDRNAGDSPDAPFQTIGRAIRDLKPISSDHILLRAGDTFDGGFNWNRSGRSAERPVLLGVYGEGDRPLIRTTGEGFIRVPANFSIQHVVFQGLHANAIRRDFDHPEFDPARIPMGEAGVTILGKANGITFEDCKIENYGFNFVVQASQLGDIRDVTLRRNIVINSWKHWDNSKGGGHSSGIYAESVQGLRFIENLFDHNGHHPQIDGADRTKFNHNIYVQYNSSDVAATGNILARGGSHGAQFRSGADVIDNLFVKNALAFFVAREPSRIIDNVILKSDDISDREPRGYGIEVLPTSEAIIENNIVAQKAGNLFDASPIKMSWEEGSMQFAKQFRVTVKDNKIYDWDHRKNTPLDIGTGAAKVTQSDNVVDDPDWPDPDRDVASYAKTLGLDASLDAFLERAASRPRGKWWPEFSATGVNAYIREGFQEQ
jgi:hypothetical protein